MPETDGGRGVDETLGTPPSRTTFPVDYYDWPPEPADETTTPRPPAFEALWDEEAVPAPAKTEPIPTPIEPLPPIDDEWQEPGSAAMAEENVDDEPPPRGDESRPGDVRHYRSERKSPRAAARHAAARSLPVLVAVAAVGLLMLGIVIGRWSEDRRDKAPSGSIGTDSVRPALQALTARVDELGRLISALPTPPDLTSMQTRFDTLARSAESTSAIPVRIEAMEGQLAQSAKLTETLGTRVADSARSIEDLNARLEGLDKVTALLRDQGKAVLDLRLDLGADLFRSGRYAAARDVFTRLREAQPDDARLWYFSALVTGFVTGKWDGETERLVLRGVERERAGSPAADTIDASFAALSVSQGKTWLESYRKRAGKR